MQDLVDDGAGERLHRLARLRGRLGDARERAPKLGEPDALETLAQRDDRRDDFDIAQPSRELHDLALHQGFGPLRLASALAEIGVDNLLQIVDVVAVHVVERSHGRFDVPGHRDIDEEQRPPAPVVHHALHEVAVDHRLRRARRRHHDVDGPQRGGKLVERHGRTGERARQLLRARPRAVGDIDGEGALIDEVLGGQLAHLPGADEQDSAPREAGEDLLRQLDGGKGDGDRVARDVRFRPHFLRDRKCLREEGVQRRPHRLAGLCERECVFHLSQDLWLAHHHRVEARRHAEGVTDRLLVHVGVDERLDGRGIDAAVLAETAEHRRAGLAGRVGDGVDLHTVARGEQDRFRRDARRLQVADQLAQLILLDGELLAQAHGRRAVIQAGDENRHQDPCRPGRNRPAPRVRTSMVKPRTAKYAARRP